MRRRVQPPRPPPKPEESAARAAYLARFPEAEPLTSFGDFAFFGEPDLADFFDFLLFLLFFFFFPLIKTLLILGRTPPCETSASESNALKSTSPRIAKLIARGVMRFFPISFAALAAKSTNSAVKYSNTPAKKMPVFLRYLLANFPALINRETRLIGKVKPKKKKKNKEGGQRRE